MHTDALQKDYPKVDLLDMNVNLDGTTLNTWTNNACNTRWPESISCQ